MSKLAQNCGRYYVGIASVLRRCAPFAALSVCLLGTGAQAGAWEEFQARCLDPYENLEPAVFDDLTKLDVLAPRIEISRHGGHFALENGAVLASDPAPLGQGERLCAVHGQADPDGVQAWIAEQLTNEFYELEERADDGSFIALTNLWIEPKLSVSVRFEEGGDYVVYQILETDLES